MREIAGIRQSLLAQSVYIDLSRALSLFLSLSLYTYTYRPIHTHIGALRPGPDHESQDCTPGAGQVYNAYGVLISSKDHGS